MKMHVLFENGVTVTVDVTSETEAGWFNERGGITLKWPPPDGWRAKLDYAKIDAITAVWFTRESARTEGEA